TAASTLTQLDANGGILDIGSTATVTTGAGNANVGGSGTLQVDGALTTTLLQVAAGGLANITGTGTVTGPVSNTGTTIVNGNVVGNVTNNANGTLKGAGTITGTVTNNGTIAPGNSPGIIHVVGAYAQGAAGIYAADLTPSGVAGTGYDQIKVTGAPGTATIAGTLALAPVTGLYVSGTTYDVIDAAGGITGSFATITGATISPFLTFTNTGIVTVAGTEQVYRLTVTRTTYAAGMGAGATPNQIAVANGFQNLVAGATGDAATLVTAVDNMTAAQAESFFDQASPEPYGAYATALQDQSELFTRQVGLHLHEGSDQPQGSSFWGRGYYGSGTGSHQAYRFGSNGDIGGGAVGLDFATGDFVVGAAGGWSEDQVKYGLGNSKGHSNSWQVGGYAGFTEGQIDADLQIAYADGSFGATKSIVVATIARGTTASFNGNLFKVVGTVGYNASLSDFTVRPFIGVDYDSGNTSQFTEAGAGAADLTVGKINMDKTNLMLGIDLIPSLTGLSPYGRLAYLYDADNKARNISAFFNGNPATAFTVSGVRPDQSEFDIDAGLAYATSANMSLYVGYQGTYRSDMNRNGVSAGLKINF
ncbi:MAG TPA: autotransporter domain-containing protein, partial [Vicinamibacterales bacterium]|nr:autotransporter domain-containing protein [Vicinamibacterales bacterium]